MKLNLFKPIKKLSLTLFISSLLVSCAVSQNTISWNKSNNWVDSVYNSMSWDERIGQLFMVDVWTMRDTAHYNQVEALVRDYKVGGLIKAHPTNKPH